MPSQPRAESARGKLLQAAVAVIRTKGYSATSVDELCAAAGVTKGAFFHHFASKEALAVAAADIGRRTTGRCSPARPTIDHADPLDRVLGYIDFRAQLLGGPVETFTCLVGTMVQEAFSVQPGDPRGVRGQHLRSCPHAGSRYRGRRWNSIRRKRRDRPDRWRCTPRPSCRARSSWRRRKADRRSPPTASPI